MAFDITRSKVLAGLPHGFFGHGGKENAPAHQFGYGGDGSASEIAEMRAAAVTAIRPEAVLVAPHQVHSPDVFVVERPWADAPEGRPVADAVVTGTPGIALGIVTADCAPVLLADPDAGIIAAAHAGWRGAQGRILGNTIDAMERLGANRSAIAAAIGPTIAQPSYEVDVPFRAHFAEDDDRFFAPGRPDHWQFDLPAFVVAQLQRAGIDHIDDCALDTFSLSARYFSYRRAAQRGESNYGRNLSVIALS
ncbi:MAG: peptidoglycan editing factor PgeF [Pseudomonadota bacterium]